LPATAPDESSARAGPNVEHVDRGADAPALLSDESYVLTPSEEAQEADKLTVNVYLLTMLVLAIASFAASVSWLLTINARMPGAICFCGVEEDRAWLATAPEGPSFLGVFRLYGGSRSARAERRIDEKPLLEMGNALFFYNDTPSSRSSA
jgi:hypothetical protein